MPFLRPSRNAQYPLIAEFAFVFNDTATDSVTGTTKTFGSVFGDAIVMDCIPFPAGAVIVGGELIVSTAGVGPTVYTAALGVAGNTDIYLAATSLLTAARTPLLLTTPLGSNAAGLNLRLTIASTVANASAGVARIRVMYTIDGRAQETQIL